MGALTKVISEVSNLRCCGLCHGPIGTTYYLGKLFGTGMDKVSTRFAGLNHLFWIIDFAVDLHVDLRKYGSWSVGSAAAYNYTPFKCGTNWARSLNWNGGKN